MKRQQGWDHSNLPGEVIPSGRATAEKILLGVHASIAYGLWLMGSATCPFLPDQVWQSPIFPFPLEKGDLLGSLVRSHVGRQPAPWRVPGNIWVTNAAPAAVILHVLYIWHYLLLTQLHSAPVDVSECSSGAATCRVCCSSLNERLQERKRLSRASWSRKGHNQRWYSTSSDWFWWTGSRNFE